jgi:hypothetical protein
MNKVTVNSGYYHLETIKRLHDKTQILYRCPTYDEDIEDWEMFGGDNEQFATLEELKEMKKSEICYRNF